MPEIVWKCQSIEDRSSYRNVTLVIQRRDGWVTVTQKQYVGHKKTCTWLEKLRIPS